MRNPVKDHGMRREVEGLLQPGMRVLVLDDACGTGSTLLHAIEAIEAIGCEVALVFVVMDWHRGGSDEIRRRGYSFVALLEESPEGTVQIAS